MIVFIKIAALYLAAGVSDYGPLLRGRGAVPGSACRDVGVALQRENAVEERADAHVAEESGGCRLGLTV